MIERYFAVAGIYPVFLSEMRRQFINRLAFLTEFFFILGHDVFLCFFRVVQIKPNAIKMHSKFIHAAKRILEQAAIIRFELDSSVSGQNIFVRFKERLICQTPFLITLFRPRIGEIKINSGNFTFIEKFSQPASVCTNKL